MRKEIATELYNYNKFPGPEFHGMGIRLRLKGLLLPWLKISRMLLMTVFNQRFSEVLTKFDYVVVTGAMSSSAFVVFTKTTEQGGKK